MSTKSLKSFTYISNNLHENIEKLGNLKNISNPYKSNKSTDCFEQVAGNKIIHNANIDNKDYLYLSSLNTKSSIINKVEDSKTSTNQYFKIESDTQNEQDSSPETHNNKIEKRVYNRIKHEEKGEGEDEDDDEDEQSSQLLFHNSDKSNSTLKDEFNRYFSILKKINNIYQCPVPNCQRQFKEKGNLKNHLRAHVKITFYNLFILLF